MNNRILWGIDTELDPKNFERMCADILIQEGYRELIPLGGNYDNGRDAEQRIYDKHNELRVTFFQFSLEKNWERKLIKELNKLEEKQHVIHEYIFVTSQSATGAKIDYYRDLIFKKYGWDFKLFGREWLRIRLEEKYSLIAKKYLRIDNDQVD